MTGKLFNNPGALSAGAPVKNNVDIIILPPVCPSAMGFFLINKKSLIVRVLLNDGLMTSVGLIRLNAVIFVTFFPDGDRAEINNNNNKP